MTQIEKPGPFGADLDLLARDAGGWPDNVMAYAVEIIGHGSDPQVMVTGSTADWMPRAKRWSFRGHPPMKAVIRLSEYRSALPARTASAGEG